MISPKANIRSHRRRLFTASWQAGFKALPNQFSVNQPSSKAGKLRFRIFTVSEKLRFSVLVGNHSTTPPTCASGDSGQCHINCWRRDKLCGDLNSQPKWPGDLDLLTLKVVSKSRATWATSVPILVFLGLSVLDLGPMYTTDVRRRNHLMAMPRRRGIISYVLNILRVINFVHLFYSCPWSGAYQTSTTFCN